MMSESAVANDTDEGLGISSDGLVGGSHVGVLERDARYAAVGLQGGYGFLESVGPNSGAHHSLIGSAAASLRLSPLFSAALGMRGWIQYHPDDTLGADKTLYGTPELRIRSGGWISRQWALGGDVRVWLPGVSAPSIVWDAVTVDLAALATWTPTSKMMLGAKAGVRLDRSAEAAPDVDRLRYGDRISLPLCDYHSILTGLVWAFQIRPLWIWTEFSADWLVGRMAPTRFSPMRLAAGVRWRLHARIQLHATVVTALGPRPNVEIDDPWIPIEPRVSGMLGMTVIFGGDKSTASDRNNNGEIAQEGERLAETPKTEAAQEQNAEKETDNAELPETEAVRPVGTVAATILDKDGLPIAGAKVTVAADGFVREVKTARDGHFEVPDVPEGEATVRVTVPYFNPLEWTAEVQAGETWRQEVPPMQESEVGSQIRGLVRNLDGLPVSAKIVVTPGGHSLSADEMGEFQLDVEPGTYSVVIEAKGYRKQVRKVTVGKNSVEILNVDLRTKR